MAAVASIKDFIITLQAHCSISKTAPELLGVYLTLHNALIDDDEEVRDQAAELVSSLLSVSSASGEFRKSTSLALNPIAASPMLLQFLVQEYHTSTGLWFEAMQRVTGDCSLTTGLPTRGILGLQLRPVQALLEEAMSANNALFVEEKQNLFVDEAKEAEMWAGVLANLHPQLDAEFMSILQTWTFDGIAALTATARNKIDGPLGWTSKPEVFTIGMRVILAARYVLRSDEKNDSLIGRTKCHEALKAFGDVAKEKLIHEMWLREIKEALG